jgi:hypothetical protein
LTIPEDKTRIIITIPKSVKEIMLKYAKKDNRKLNNYISNLLINYHQELEDKNRE